VRLPDLQKNEGRLQQDLYYYAEFKQTGYGATDHRLKVRIAKCKADLIEALGAYKVSKQPI
jgi:hypothetical protein